MASLVNAAKERQYKPQLVSLMKFLDGRTDYDRNSVFARNRLLQITPEDLLRKFNNDVWGTPNPPANHDITPLKRCSTIKGAKKAISYYMPNNMMVWNEERRSGNPTRSRLVNDLIQLLLRLETRRQGARSQVRRAFNDGDFRQLRRMLKEDTEDIKKFGIPAFNNMQFHLIARIDDTANMKMQNLKQHPNFDFALKVKLNWSKNVREERDAPFQSVLASNDHTYCVILGLAVWHELFLGMSPNANNTPYLFSFNADVTVPKGANKSKNFVAKALRDILRTEEFRSVAVDDNDDEDNTGSHSTRKYAASEARNSGGSKDETDLRGRWKCRRVSDTYANVELPYPDAKMASYLCKGGPIRYAVVDPNVTDDWLVQHVAMNVKKRFNNAICLVLAKALLWACFAQEDEVPPTIRRRIRNSYAHLPNFQGNPVKKIPIVITGDQGRVFMDDIPEEMQGHGGTGAANFVDRPVREQLLALHSTVTSLRRGITTVTDKVEQTRVEQKRQFTTIKTSIQRISNTPARLIGGGTNAAPRHNANNALTMAVAATGRPAVLSMPRDLYQRWNEFIQGNNGNKPASQFTARERGRFKHKYTRRKVFWDHIQLMVLSGLSINVAIDRMYEVYGREKSVTAILNSLRRDRNANNLHVSLRV